MMDTRVKPAYDGGGVEPIRKFGVGLRIRGNPAASQ